MQKDDVVLHFESHRDTVFLVCLLVAAVIGIGVFASTVFVSHEWGYPAGVGVGIVLTFIMYKFRSPMILKITPDEIVFGFPLHKWRFNRSDLVFCMPYEQSSVYSNILRGWRAQRDTFRAPVLNKMSVREAMRFPKPNEVLTAVGKDGKAVRMEFRNAERPFSVHVTNPIKVCALLESPAPTQSGSHSN